MSPEPREPDRNRELQQEAQRLSFARHCLKAMGDALRGLEASGGDPVSVEYLKAELFRRAQALLDDPTTPLFFGRIDRADADENFYIGRRHVRDTKGDPVVVDWRAEISRAFYRASASDPMGMALRRRFGFNQGVLTSLEDERLDLGDVRDPASSAILTSEIERPRIGPMRDIVATIQPDQDVLVRASLNETICIQGAPGTGKTAVGLHRAAYLLYAHRDQLKRTGVLVVGPNRSFLGYIGALLPALGELDVEQIAITDLPREAAKLPAEDAATAIVKGDERMAEVIRRAVHRRIVEPTESLLVETPTWRHRVPAHELAALIERQRSADSAYDVGRRRLPNLIAESVRRRMEAGGGAPDDRLVAKLARGSDIKGWVDAHWPKLTARAVVTELLTDRAVLAECASGLLSDHEQGLISRTPSPGSDSARSAMRWSAADTFLLDEAAGQIERPRSFGHVVVDEAQDLTPMQCRALARRCPAGSMTILGDLAQATNPGAIGNWSRSLRILGQGDGSLISLTRGYRVPEEIIDVANRLLPHLKVDVDAATSLRRGHDSLLTLAATAPIPSIVAETRRMLELPGSIGIIATGGSLAGVGKALGKAGIESAAVESGMTTRVTLVPVNVCKGLEFDHVIVLEPAEIVASLPRGLNWLYVALTRAVSSLTVIHADALPPELVA